MKKWTKLIALTLLAAVFLTACGGKSPQNSGAYYPSDMETAGGSFYYDEAYDYAPMEVPAPEPAYNSEAKPANSADGKQSGLILTFSADVDIETLDFEQSMQAIRSAIEACGGYISSQRQNGGYTNYGGYYVTQSVDMQIKVPADRFQEFLNGTAQFGNVTSVNSWQEDITGAYMDTKARLESLESQRQRLMAMMDQAETVSDLIQIEAQLSETIYQIESYTSQMKIYQGLADYSTIDISLREVSVVTSNPQTFGERIIETFKRTDGISSIPVRILCSHSLSFFRDSSSLQSSFWSLSRWSRRGRRANSGNMRHGSRSSRNCRLRLRFSRTRPQIHSNNP